MNSLDYAVLCSFFLSMVVIILKTDIEYESDAMLIYLYL